MGSLLSSQQVSIFVGSRGARGEVASCEPFSCCPPKLEAAGCALGPGLGVGLSAPSRQAAGEEALRTEGATQWHRRSRRVGGRDGISASFPSQHVGRRRARWAGWGECQPCPSSPRISEVRALSLLAKSRWWTMYPMPRLLFFSQKKRTEGPWECGAKSRRYWTLNELCVDVLLFLSFQKEAIMEAWHKSLTGKTRQISKMGGSTQPISHRKPLLLNAEKL